jgi:membrane protein DedA with SNARE-associated domain
VTVTCGIVGYDRKRFVLATACAGIIWASYAYFLGRLGGAAFEGRPWAGFLLALGAALVLSALVEVVRRVRERRARDRLAPGSPGTPGPPVAALHTASTDAAPVPHRERVS